MNSPYNVLDRNIAQSMVAEDFLRSKIRRNDAISDRLKPQRKETPWGKFPKSRTIDTVWDGLKEVPAHQSRKSVQGMPRTKSYGALSPPSRNTETRPKSANYARNRKPTGQRHNQQSFHVYGSRPQSASAMHAAAGLKQPKQDPKEAEAKRQEAEELRKYMSSRGRFHTNPRRMLEEMADIQNSREPARHQGSKSSRPQSPIVSKSRARPRSGIRTNSKDMDMTRTAFSVLGEKYERPRTAPTKRSQRATDPGPGKAGAYRYRQIEQTLFRKYYDRGDLPVVIEHRPSGNSTRWTRDLYELDYHIYLPIFFDGLREVDDPYRFLAVQGTLDMILVAPEKVLPVVPQIILPLKAALNTRHPQILCPTLKVLQQMVVQNPLIGQALVPYYRQLLPVFNLFKNKENNLGDEIAYDQRQRSNVGELIRETLEIFEANGGPDAFINIKYMIPTYESCCV